LSQLELFVPGFFREEFAKHLPRLQRRAGLTERGARDLADSLEAYLTVMPEEALLPFLARAAEVMGPIDPQDTDSLAAALATECDGIWSDDPHFKRQRVMACWTTEELVAALRQRGVPL
jgi:predicted nucleic acid-binding protein